MITNRKEIKLYKAKSILDVTEKDSLYCLKADNETEFKIVVTDAFGNPVNLKDLTGVSGSGIQSVVAGTNIVVDNTDTLNPVISSTASGATNLGYTPSSTDGVVTSDTGSDATIPLANGINSGLSKNNFTDGEKTKLSGIEAGAEVNNISDANATDLTDGGETILHTHDSRYYTETEIDAFLSNYVPTTRTVNSKALSSDITLTPSDIGSPSGSGTSTGTNTGDQDLSGLMVKTANGSDINNIKTFRANLGVDKLTQNGDSNYTILSTDKVVVTSATFTLPRTWTLPLANSVNVGYEIIIADLFGGVSATNTLIISRNGSDTINGTTSQTIGAQYGMRRLISDGVSKWTFDAGVMRVSDYIGTTLTASKIVGTDSNSKLQPLDTATYPSLTELSYVKGLTSSAQTQITANAVNVITITTSISIDTDTTSGGYGQHGRHTKISNGANAINLTVQTSSNADFVASYEKIGSSTITFVAGSGATLIQLSGTALLSGAVGSKACLSRNGNTYYLQITNY